MSFHVILVDKSEIIKKMLSHCLYYFAAEVSRLDHLPDMKSHFLDKKPDIIFIDWDGGGEAISSAISEIHPTPAVLLYRSKDEAQISAMALEKPAHKIKKPLDPKVVRDIFTKLVPQAKDSKIHSFLKFPKSQAQKQEPAPQGKPLSPSHLSEKPEREEHKEEIPPLKAFGVPKAKAQEPPDPWPSIPAEDPKKTAQKSTDSLSSGVKKGFSAPYSPSQENSDLINKKNLSGKKLDKENINIDESTQNDLAPMAIKSASENKRESDIKNWELSEKDILRVLNKYKDSLEFQELMERTLSEYAKKTVVDILQGNKPVDLLREPLNEFKEGGKFKALVEKEIIQYVRKNLPLLLKEVVEREIKKIIGG